MLRAILRNVQFTLLLSASLLVLLAFQRLRNDDLFFAMGQFQHADPSHHFDRRDIVGVGGGRHGSKIFSTNVIEIGLFRFVVPFRWASAGPDGEEIAASAGPPKAPAAARRFTGRMREKMSAGRGRHKRGTKIEAASSSTAEQAREDGASAEEAGRGRDSFAERKSSASVAYLVPVRSCPPDELELTDGLAVLRQSVVSAHNASSYAYEVFAIVNPDTEVCDAEARTSSLGFSVIAEPVDGERSSSRMLTRSFTGGAVPLASRRSIAGRDFAASETPHVPNGRDMSDEKSGESMIARVLSGHDIVVLLPMDAMVTRPLDDLFDALLDPKELLPRLEKANLLEKADDERADESPRRVGAFLARDDLDFAVVRGDWNESRRVLSEMMKVDVEGGSRPGNNSTSSSARGVGGRARLARLYARRPRRKSPGPAGLGSESGGSVRWLSPCLFGGRGKRSGGGGGGRCDDAFGGRAASFRDARVVLSGSCSPPWGCDGRGHGNDGDDDDDGDGDYCGELHRAWFRYRTQLDLSGAPPPARPSVRGSADIEMGNEVYGTYCKHGGAGGYVRYDPPRRRTPGSGVARLLMSLGWA